MSSATGHANVTFSAYGPFAARHNMLVLYSSVLSQAFLHPPFARGKKQTNCIKSFTPLWGWRITTCLMKPPPPYQPTAPVILGHKVVRTGAASLPHSSSFLPLFHSLTIILQTEGGGKSCNLNIAWLHHMNSYQTKSFLNSCTDGDLHNWCDNQQY